MNTIPKSTFIIVGVILIILVLSIMYTIYTIALYKKLPEDKKFVKVNKRFRFYSNFYLTRTSFRKIHEQVQSLGAYSWIQARMVTVNFVERSAITSVILFLVGVFGLRDIISAIFLFFFSILLFNRTVMLNIDAVKRESVRATEVFILSLLQAYAREGNIPGAIRECDCPDILLKQRDTLHKIVTQNHGAKLLDNFIEECPNKTMRTLAIACHLANDQGDTTEISPFKRALKLVKQEVSDSVTYTLKQHLMFKRMERLPLAPLFAYPIIMSLFIRILPATQSVFESDTGYVIKIAILATALISYYLLSTINNPTVATSDDRIYFIKQALMNTKFSAFANTLITKSHKQRYKYRESIKSSLSSKDLQYLFVEKYLFGSVLFISSVFVTFFIITAGKAALESNIMPLSVATVTKYTAEEVVALTDYDKYLMSLDELPSDEELRDTFSEVLVSSTSINIDSQIDRVKIKFKQYKGLTYKWYMSFISIALFFVGFYIPDFLLKLRVYMVKAESEEDVLQMHTIIAITMDTNLDTLQVLYWLQRTSDIHRDILLYAYHEYTRDAHMALARLRDKGVIPEFKDICTRLLDTVDRATVGEVFADLVEERESMIERRKEIRLSALNNRRALANPIALAPAYVTLILCFILPVALVAWRAAVITLGNMDF